MKNAVCYAQNPSVFNGSCGEQDNVCTKYLRAIASIPILTPQEEKILAKKVYEGNSEAKKLLAKSNLRLAANIAMKNSNAKIPLIDLIQEANIGLMVAIEKFNYKFGYKFSTYASWWIKQGVLKAISEQSNCVKIPVYVQETMSKYNKRHLGVKASNNETNINSEKLEEYLKVFKSTVSFDEPLDFNKAKDASLLELVADENTNATLFAEFDNLKEDIDKAINTLNHREKEVIRLRFGLEDYARKTLDEVGKIFGVTKECVRQTEIRALKKLKELCLQNEMIFYYQN